MSYNFAHNQSTFNKPSTFGLSPNAAALISYIWIPVTSAVVLVTEKENRFVRFHAFQSLFMGLTVFVGTLVLAVIIGVLTLVAGAVSSALGIIVSMVSLLIWMVIAAALLALWVFCLVKAYRGETFKLPVVGAYAEKMVGK
jgi:uncharacterized membrane protein